MIRHFSHMLMLLILAAGFGSAATLTFGCIPGGPGTCTPDLSDQLFADVTDAGGTLVDFTFRNEGPESSFISDIYFDTFLGYFSSLVIQTEGPGVSFTAPSAGGNLPRGNTLTPPFDEDWQTHNSPGAANGINPGEFLTLRAGGQTFAMVIADLENASVRIGMHVQGIGPLAVSDAYVNNPPTQVIPEPSTFGMLLIGTGMVIAGIRRRRSV